MPIIKDKDYWKIYNQKRREYIQQKNKERYSKSCINTPEKDTTEINTTSTDTTNNTTFSINTTEPKKDTTTEKIQPIQPTEKVVKNQENILQPPKCSYCPQLEKELTICQGYYQQSLKDYDELGQKYNDLAKQKQSLIEKLKATSQNQQDKQTISDLQEQNKKLIQNLTKLENHSKNNNNSLSMTNLSVLIEKHKQFQSSQHFYSDRDIKEREFLKNLLDKLWSFI